MASAKAAKSKKNMKSSPKAASSARAKRKMKQKAILKQKDPAVATGEDEEGMGDDEVTIKASMKGARALNDAMEESKHKDATDSVDADHSDQIRAEGDADMNDNDDKEMDDDLKDRKDEVTEVEKDVKQQSEDMTGDTTEKKQEHGISTAKLILTRGNSSNNHSMPRVIRESSQVLEQDVVRSTRTVNGGIVVGQNVSGRTWKTRVQKRASSLQTSVPLNNLSKSWARKMEQKEQRRLIQQHQAQLSEDRRLEKVQRRERRLENERRRAENQFKAQQVFAQTLHPERVQQKLKAMSKKQLRQIKKTRLNPQTGAVEYVPAYSK